MATKKTSDDNSETTEAPRTGAVAAFILGQPADMKAVDVVAAGKAAGHSFGTAYVYTVRGRTKAGAKPRASSKRRAEEAKLTARAQRALAKLERKGVRRDGAPEVVHAVKARPAASTSRPSLGDAERQLAALIVQVGTERAEAILARVKEALSKLTL